MVGFFIQRPIFASAIAVIMVLAGAICYFLLPVSQFPDITPPQVVVSANYPGASAQVVADTVTTPLEEQINGVEGMTYMSSSSSNDGSSTITVTFNVGYPLDIAAVDVQNRVSQAASSLPAIVNQGGVTIKKQNPNFVLIVNLDLARRFGRSGGADQLRLSADRRSAEAAARRRRRPDFRRAALFDARLARSRQARQSRHHGGRRAERHRRAERPGRRGQDRPVAGASRHAVRNAGQRRRAAQRPGGILQHRRARRSRPAAPSCGLRDVARVELGALQYSSSAYFGKDPTVVMAMFQMPGSNALDLQQRVKDEDGGAVEALPARASPTRCTTTRRASSRRRCTTSSSRSSRRLLLVVFVVFVFLQSWRTTIIPTIAIPVSLIATLAVMQVFGFSLNMLSLLGMVLAIGLVVDDAIVVVENVERQLEAGLPPLAAARKGDGGSDRADHRDDRGADGGVRAGRLHSGRRGPALQPVRADGRDLGRHIRLQFADAEPGAQRGVSAPWPEGIRSVPLVQRRLRLALARLCALRCGSSSASAGRWSASSSCLSGAPTCCRGIPSTFLPVEDQGYFFVVVQVPDGASLERTDAVAKKVRDILQATPGVEIAGFISGLNFLTNAAQSNSAVEFAILKPWARARAGRERVGARRFGATETARNSRGLRAEFRSALGQRPRHDRRLRIRGRGSRRARRRALNDATQALIAAARKQPELNPQALFTSFSASIGALT